MTRLYDKYGPAGFTILAFPCNQYLRQEPGTAAEIKALVREKYGGQFPLFDKIKVKGPDTHPVYCFLLRCFPGKIGWNFRSQFFCDANGVPIKRLDGGDNWEEIERIIQSHVGSGASSPNPSDPVEPFAGSSQTRPASHL